MAIVGYARVSSVGQDHGGQVERLKAAGATRIFQEKRSGVDREREELKKCLDYVREGDALLVTKLDRLARSAVDLLNIVKEMQAKGVAFKALDQSLDMTTPAGKLQLQVLAAVAEFETAIRRERQMEGIARAKAEGRTGRPKRGHGSNRQGHMHAPDLGRKLPLDREECGFQRGNGPERLEERAKQADGLWVRIEGLVRRSID
ncbi:recombinase family protein [Rhizobium yanglingense]